MGKIGRITILGGLGLTMLVFSIPVQGIAAISSGLAESPDARVTIGVCGRGAQDAVLLAQGGKGNGRGRWSNGDNSGGRGGYGVQDGSGTAARPQDGTGYGAKSGKGSGTCDGTGPKAKGRGSR
jgi:hypothetical protein